MHDYIELKDEEAQLIDENRYQRKLVISIAILGEVMAGKSYVFNKFLEAENKQTSDFQVDSYTSTYGYQKKLIQKDFFQGSENLNSYVMLYDTAGNYRYRLLTNAHYANFLGVIYVFDVQN